MSKKSITVTLDKSDLATILAALRCFQEKYENWNAKAIREDWPDHFEGVKPLGTADISYLCEQINTSNAVSVKSKNKDSLLSFVQTIARMKTEEEFGDNAPPSEDWISTLNDLIAQARKF